MGEIEFKIDHGFSVKKIILGKAEFPCVLTELYKLGLYKGRVNRYLHRCARSIIELIATFHRVKCGSNAHLFLNI